MNQRTLVVGLIASLAVNLFVLGGLAGAAMIGYSHHRQPGGPPRLAAMGAGLSQPQREAWHAALRQAVATTRPKLQQARQLRGEAWRDLAREGANPEAVLAELHQSRTLELQARSEMDRAVVRFAAALPAEERQKLADALSRRRRDHPPGDKSGRGP